MRGDRFLLPFALPTKLLSVPRWPNWYWRNLENWARNTDAHDLLLFSKAVNYASIAGIFAVFIASLAGWFLPPMTTHFKVNTTLIGLSVQDGDQLPKWGPQIFEVVPTFVTQIPASLCRRATFQFKTETRQRADNTQSAALAVNIYFSSSNNMVVGLGHASEDTFNRFGTLNCLTRQAFPQQFSLRMDRILIGEEAGQTSTLSRTGSQIDSLRLQGRISALGTDAGSGVYGPNQLHVIKSGLVESKVPTWPFASGEIKSETAVGPLDGLSFVENVRGTLQPALTALDIASSADGLQVSGFVVADEVIVKRFGAPEGTSVKLRPTLLHRLRAQEEWLLLLALFFSIQFLRVSWEAYVRSFWVQSVALNSNPMEKGPEHEG